jgi:conjugative relaxase-like TrwC/TraI family protein
MLASPQILKVKLNKPGGAGGGQKGNTRGNSVSSILDYLEDKRAMDYYGEDGQAPETCMGAGWADLGVDKTQGVTRAQKENLMMGLGPNGEKLAKIKQTKEGEIRVGVDCAFTIPKTASVAWAFGDKERKAGIDEDMRLAIEDTLRHIEKQGYITVRGGLNGTKPEAANRLSAIAYFHDTSRPEDPNKHVHLTINSLAKTESGLIGRIEPKGLFHHKVELGAYFRASFSARQAMRGQSIERDEKFKSFKFVGVDQDLCDEMSKGGNAIKQQLDDWGALGPQAAANASTAIRNHKVHTPADVLDARWFGEAVRLGLDPDAVTPELETDPAKVKTGSYDEAAIIADLSARKATFTDLELRRAVTSGLDAGAMAEGMRQGKTVEEIWESSYAAITMNPEMIKLRDIKGMVRWTTKEMREIEQRLVSNVESLKGKAHEVDLPLLSKCIRQAEEIKAAKEDKPFKFSEEQLAAILHLAGGKNGVRYLQGVGGGGKSTLTAAIALYNKARGVETYAIAFSSIAATGLGEEAGLKSRTMESFFLSVEGGHLVPKKGSTILLDETSMNDTRQIDRLVSIVKKYELEVSLIGHTKQLQAIGAGSAFAYLYERAGKDEKAEIKTSQRQRGIHAHEWRGFLEGVTSGKNKEVLQYLEKLGNLKLSEDGEDIKDSVMAWKKNRDAGLRDDDNVLITNTNAKKKTLNDAVRVINGQADRPDNVTIKTTGRDGGSRGDRSFAPGDRVISLRNDKKLRIKEADDFQKIDNGAQWTIKSIEPGTNAEGKSDHRFTLVGDNGTEIQFLSSQYDALDHGYCLTVHQSQGISKTGVVGCFSDLAMADLHSFYVILGRARNAEHTHLVMPSHILDEAEAIAQAVEAVETDDLDEAAQKPLVDRLDNFLKAVSRERYDYLSIDETQFKLEQTYQAELAAKGPEADKIYADAWMEMSGGTSGLTPDQLTSSRKSFDEWAISHPEPAEKYGFDSYVDYVQEQHSKTRQAEAAKGETVTHKTYAQDIEAAKKQEPVEIDEAESESTTQTVKPARVRRGRSM